MRDHTITLTAYHWLQDVVAGVIIAIVVLALAGSYTLLIFSQPITEYSEWAVRRPTIGASRSRAYQAAEQPVLHCP
jgi:hypothetical protein